ncbi:MAG: ABC transporter substrate-binding protein [Haloferacaceae archaeon]
MRVVSILPSATEILYALGVEPVGVSHECDYPPAAASVPAVNRSRVDPEAGSDEINDQVDEAVADHGSVYEIDDETLRDLDPDVVVTQGVCDVCAVDRVLVREAVERLDLDCDVLTTDPHSLADVLADVERFGEVLGRQEQARAVVAELRDRIERVEERVALADRRPRVSVLDWMDPVMVAGHWMPDLVERAGGTYGITEPGAHSVPLEWDVVREFDPEVLVAAPCGFDVDHALRDVADLTGREGWADLAAVREGAAYAMDGNQYVNRPGPRLVDTLEYLASVIHPDQFESPPADAVRPIETPHVEI